MDFITQNLLGAVAAHAALGRKKDGAGLGRLALLAGAAGGALPDLDIFLQPLADPALPFELHRHFTHALVFIPVGGLLATLPLLAFAGCRRRLGLTCAAATLGCATHGLLDNLTSYGTHLLWPFVAHRTSWDSMSIVDPLFTGVLLLGIFLALVRGRQRPTRVALSLALAYIGFGFVQHERAVGAQRTLAHQRGHEIERGRALPTLGNLIVFRSVYEAEGRLWVDALRLPVAGGVAVREGSSIPRFTETDLPIGTAPRTRQVYLGFEAFADGYMGRIVAGADRDRSVLGDMRFSLSTNGFRPLWGITIDPRHPEPIAWDAFSRGGQDTGRDLRGMFEDVLQPEGRFRTLGPETLGSEY